MPQTAVLQRFSCGDDDVEDEGRRADDDSKGALYPKVVLRHRYDQSTISATRSSTFVRQSLIDRRYSFAIRLHNQVPFLRRQLRLLRTSIKIYVPEIYKRVKPASIA